MKEQGYTLVEVMVAVGVFFLVIGAFSNFFVSSLRSQQKTISLQELIDGVSYDLEYMTRALRMARKDAQGICIDTNHNYKITKQGLGIKFLNYQGACQEFFLDKEDSRLKEIKGDKNPIAISSDDLSIESFKIGPQDSWDIFDYKQSRVTLYVFAKGKRFGKNELQPEIKIQTTISQRILDVI